MKKTIKRTILIALSLSGLLFSVQGCDNSEVENVFKKSPEERIMDRTAEFKNLLLSQPTGFKGYYYPNADKYGGYFFLMNFQADGTVQMTSDVDDLTDIQSSYYRIHADVGIDINFDTKNHIHKLSDTDIFKRINPSINNEFRALEGGYSFEYVRTEGDKIILRDIIRRGILTLEPAKAEDWQNDIKNLQKVSHDFLNPNISAFSALVISSASKKDKFGLNYNKAFRRISIEGLPGDGDSPVNFSSVLAYGTDGESIILSPALKYKGQEFKEFKRDVSSGSFVSKSGEYSVSFASSQEPAKPLTEINDLYAEREKGYYRKRYFLFKTDLNDPRNQQEYLIFSTESSETFRKEVLDNLTSDSGDRLDFIIRLSINSRGNERISQLSGLTNTANPENQVAFTLIIINRGAAGLPNKTYNLTFDNFRTQDNKLFMDYSDTNRITNKIARQVVEFFTDPKGLFYYREDKSSHSYGNFISASHPGQRVSLFFWEF